MSQIEIKHLNNIEHGVFFFVVESKLEYASGNRSGSKLSVCSEILMNCGPTDPPLDHKPALLPGSRTGS